MYLNFDKLNHLFGGRDTVEKADVSQYEQAQNELFDKLEGMSSAFTESLDDQYESVKNSLPEEPGYEYVSYTGPTKEEIIADTTSAYYNAFHENIDNWLELGVDSGYGYNLVCWVMRLETWEALPDTVKALFEETEPARAQAELATQVETDQLLRETLAAEGKYWVTIEGEDLDFYFDVEEVCELFLGFPYREESVLAVAPFFELFVCLVLLHD